jgi:hypothetical protein
MRDRNFHLLIDLRLTYHHHHHRLDRAVARARHDGYLRAQASAVKGSVKKFLLDYGPQEVQLYISMDEACFCTSPFAAPANRFECGLPGEKIV